MATNGNDLIFFEGSLQQLTLLLVNPYSGFSYFVDEVKNVNIYSYDGLAGTDSLNFTSQGDYIALTNAQDIQVIFNIERFSAGNGGDIINLSHATIIYGNVLLNGSDGDDLLWANAGNDTLNGAFGNDILDGGPGNDILNGDAIGFAYNDILSGGAGDDVLDGTEGDDTLTGGAGNDILNGNSTTTLAIFSNARTDYSVVDQGGGTIIVTDLRGVSPDGTDTLNGIAFYQFSNATYTLAEALVPPNSDPLAADDTIVTDEDTSVTFDVRTNDSDADSDPLTVTHINGAAIVAGGAALAVPSGAVALGLDGQLTFSPGANANGPVSFGYTVADGNGGTADATVNLTINPINDAPVQTGAQIVLPHGTEGVPYTLTVADLLAGFTDVDGDPLSLFEMTPSTGAINQVLDQITVFVAPDFHGTETLTYGVTDFQGGLVMTSQQIIFDPVNDAPVITSNGGGDTAAVSIAENGLAVTNVTADDVDGDALTYSITGGADATLFGIDAATGTLSFLVAPDFEAATDTEGSYPHYPDHGVYQVTVSASDGTGTDTQALSITVTNVIEGNTITGTVANDVINTKKAPSGQPFVTANDDLIFGGDGNDILDGGAGGDHMYGGAGNDTYFIDSYSYPPNGKVGDQVIELFDGGIDTVKTSSFNLELGANVEKGTLLDVKGVGVDLVAVGNELDNTLTGNRGNNWLYGLDGSDILNGKDGNDLISGDAGDDKLNGGNGDDDLQGGAGVDFLTGGAGADTLTGGTEADQFKFDKFMLADGLLKIDTITDFSGFGGEGDRINLSAIDANSGLGGNQKFAFIGTAAFGGVAGQLRYEQSGGDTWLSGDINGDTLADIQIIATGLHSFVASDFIL